MRLLTPRSPEIEGHSRGRTAPTALLYGAYLIGTECITSKGSNTRAAARRHSHGFTYAASIAGLPDDRWFAGRTYQRLCNLRVREHP